MVLDLNKKTCLLITGASRGIGASMATSLATKLGAGSVILLVARTRDDLYKIGVIIEEIAPQVKVVKFTMDLSKASIEEFRIMLNNSLCSVDEKPENFERAFIMHNAGTVGDVSKRAVDATDVNEWQQYFQLNLFSAITLNAQFVNFFPKAHKVVVNISSKCATEPFVSMSFYCSAKAARDMYFRVLAAEQPDILVLNYAPGAIDTDMTVYVQAKTFDPKLRQAFQSQREKSTILTTSQTVDRFIYLLENKDFNSGDHIDYWDVQTQSA